MTHIDRLGELLRGRPALLSTMQAALHAAYVESYGDPWRGMDAPDELPRDRHAETRRLMRQRTAAMRHRW